MDETACHIRYILNRCFNEAITSVEATREAEDAWVEEIIAVSRYNEDFLNSCTPGYYNNEGRPDPKSVQNGPYGKGSRPYFRITEAWRDEGNMQGLAQRR